MEIEYVAPDLSNKLTGGFSELKDVFAQFASPEELTAEKVGGAPLRGGGRGRCEG